MPYLFRHRPPTCAEDGCLFPGSHDVRSNLLFKHDRPIPKPLCLRHAKKLYAAFEAEEKQAQPAASGGPGEGTAPRPQGAEGDAD